MNFNIPAALAATPGRLSALLLLEEDAEIDAEIAEAEEETGLFDGLTGTELAKQRYLYRVRLFAEELLNIVEDADGTTEDNRQRRAAWRAEVDELGLEEACARSAANSRALMSRLFGQGTAPAEMA